jgi:hypothetical protein
MPWCRNSRDSKRFRDSREVIKIFWESLPGAFRIVNADCDVAEAHEGKTHRDPMVVIGVDQLVAGFRRSGLA